MNDKKLQLLKIAKKIYMIALILLSLSVIVLLILTFIFSGFWYAFIPVLISLCVIIFFMLVQINIIDICIQSTNSITQKQLDASIEKVLEYTKWQIEQYNNTDH